MPLVNCIFNDGLDNAMPNMQQMLLQFIDVVHLPAATAIYKEYLIGIGN